MNILTKIFLSLFLAGTIFITVSHTISAQSIEIVYEDEGENSCTSPGQCINNYKCIEKSQIDQGGKIIVTIGRSSEPNCNSSVVGAVKPPIGISEFDNRSGADSSGQQIGIIFFASNLLRLFATIAGIWAMFNIGMAGYMYITAMSDAGVTEKVKDKITMTVIGLAIIAGSYIIAGLIGLVMFGDATFIISPKLYQAGAPTP